MENKSVGCVVGYDRELRELIIKGPKKDVKRGMMDHWLSLVAGIVIFIGIVWIITVIFTLHVSS